MSLRCALLAWFMLVCSHARFASGALAQDTEAYVTDSADTSEADARDERDERDEDPMGDFSLGVQVGYGRVGTGDVQNPTYVEGAQNLDQATLQRYGLIGTEGCTPIDRRCRTEARSGVHLALPIQIGGSIIGFRLEPYMTLSSAAKAYGLYTGPTFEFHVVDPLYLGFGFGLQLAWVKDREWKYAADIYGRIPMRATYYVVDNFALVLEFAFGAGASGYVGEIKDVIDPRTGKRITRRQDITFGVGRTWDLSLGFRFP